MLILPLVWILLALRQTCQSLHSYRPWARVILATFLTLSPLLVREFIALYQLR